MAAINIKPVRNSGATAGISGTNATVSFQVPSGKRWLFDTATLVCDDASSPNNYCDIQIGSSPATIVAYTDQASVLQNLDTTIRTFRFLDFFPRAVEIEQNEYIKFKFTEVSAGGAVIFTAILWVMESDL